MRTPRARPSSRFSLPRPHGLGPVLLGSAVAGGLLLVRLAWSGRPAFLFLVWNLFGRFERWNSWNVLDRPRSLLEAVLDHLREPWAYRWLGLTTAVFAGLVVLSSLAFELLVTRRRAERVRA